MIRYKERLDKEESFSLESQRLRDVLIGIYEMNVFSHRVKISNTIGKGFKVSGGKFKLSLQDAFCFAKCGRCLRCAVRRGDRNRYTRSVSKAL